VSHVCTIPRDILVSAYFPRFTACSCIFWAAPGRRVAYASATTRFKFTSNADARRAACTYFAYHVGERVKGRWWSGSAPADFCTHRKAQGAGFVVQAEPAEREREMCVPQSQNFNYHLEHAITRRRKLDPGATANALRFLSLAYYFHVTLKTDCEIKRSPKTARPAACDGKIETCQNAGWGESENIGVLTQEDWKDLRARVMSRTTAAV